MGWGFSGKKGASKSERLDGGEGAGNEGGGEGGLLLLFCGSNQS